MKAKPKQEFLFPFNSAGNVLGRCARATPKGSISAQQAAETQGAAGPPNRNLDEIGPALPVRRLDMGHRGTRQGKGLLIYPIALEKLPRRKSCEHNAGDSNFSGL